MYYKILLNNTYKINTNELKNDVDVFSKFDTLEILDELYKGYQWIKIAIDDQTYISSISLAYKYKKKYDLLLKDYNSFFDSLDSSLKLYLVTLGYNGFTKD